MLSLALALTGILATGQKTTEVWRLRTNLNGKYVEIYEVYKGEQKLGTGLRQIVERHNYYQPAREKKYADILKPEWGDIWLFQERFIFAKPKDHRFDSKLWIIPSREDKGRIKVEKAVETPYVDLYGGVTSIMTGGNDVVGSMARANAASDVFAIRADLESGKRPNIEDLAKLHLGYQSGRVMSLDVMDRDLNVKFTVHNARVLPRRYGKSWQISYDTNELAPLTVFLNDQGEPVSPEFPLIREFVGGVLAVPTSLEFERYIPILADGRTKIEAWPTKGYFPDVAINAKKWQGSPMTGWVKEYITPEGSRFGWASLDLSRESGPIWRSIDWWEHSFHPQVSGRAILAQLNDGSWMIYDYKASSTESPYRPYFARTFATREAVIEAYKPIFTREVAEPILARRRQEAEAYRIQYDEMTKYLEVDPAMSAGGMAMGELRSRLYATITSLNARLLNDFDEAYKRLPGDYFLKYLAVAYQMRRVGLTEESAKAYAAQAVHPGIKQTFESIAERVKVEEAQRAKRAEDEKRARELALSNPQKFSARPPAATPGWSSPWTNAYAQPSFAESSRRHEQYMSQMWKYLGGQQAWRPY